MIKECNSDHELQVYTKLFLSELCKTLTTNKEQIHTIISLQLYILKLNSVGGKKAS